MQVSTLNGIAFLYGFVAVSVINLTALFGIVYVPLRNKSYYGQILSFMTALAVGSLIATSVFVLIPESLNEEKLQAGTTDLRLEFVHKMSCFFAGIMFFLILEHVLRRVSVLISSRTKKNSPTQTLPLHTHGHSHLINSEQLKLEQVQTNIPIVNIVPVEEEEEEAKSMQEPRKELLSLAEAPPVVWMIVLGDTFHNFMDGIAIGVGFSQSFHTGLFLSVSVFCEECPHELGDFAVLLHSGLNVRRVMLLNFISACSCYIGLVVGILVGELGHASEYVFALTAGMFIYISMTDMLPELQTSVGNNKAFLIECVGLCVGFGLIFSFTYLDQLYLQPKIQQRLPAHELP